VTEFPIRSLSPYGAGADWQPVYRSSPRRQKKLPKHFSCHAIRSKVHDP